MNPKWIAGLIATVVVGSFTALFAWQNSSRVTDLSLNLGFEPLKMHLAEPVSVPLLMGICFGAGLILGIGFLGVRVLTLSGKVRRLEQQLVLSDGAGDDREWR